MRMTRVMTVVMVAISMLAGVARADDAAELEKLRAENAALKARVAELEQKLGITEQKLADTQKQTEAIAAERNELAAEKQATEAQRREYYVESSYDSGSDTTKLMGRPSRLEITKGAKLRHWLNLYATHDGKTPTSPPADIKMVIQTSFSGTMYRGTDDVALTVDGEPMTLKVVDYDNVYRTTGSTRTRTRNDDETLVISVPIESAKKIAASTNVTGRLAHSTMQLNMEQIEAFEAMLTDLGVD